MANTSIKITVKRQYISYGLAFNPESFNEVKNYDEDDIYNKPCYCGMWASPIDAQYSWFDYCIARAREPLAICKNGPDLY